MPVLKDFRNTRTITLPSFPDSKVVLYDSLLVGDMMNAGLKQTTDSVEQGIKIMPLIIKEWNFTNEKEEPLPITLENIGFLKQVDIIFLLNEFTKFSDENKKKEK